jgi:hypothetical protein
LPRRQEITPGVFSEIDCLKSKLAVIESGRRAEQADNGWDLDSQLPFIGASAECDQALGCIWPPWCDAASQRLQDEYTTSSTRAIAQLLLDAASSPIWQLVECVGSDDAVA